jgi:hypothetical protein
MIVVEHEADVIDLCPRLMVIHRCFGPPILTG